MGKERIVNKEALGFAMGALNSDKDKFMEISQLVSMFIEQLQRSGANPITIYYATRAIEGYAQDRLEAFGQAAEKSGTLGPNIDRKNIREACDELFSTALEDVVNMREVERRSLVQDLRQRYYREKLWYIG